MSATSSAPNIPAGWEDKPGYDYVTVVARADIGPRVALWERDPAHPNGEVSVEGAQPGEPLMPCYVARTSLVNDRLHPRAEAGGTLRIVEGDEAGRLAETYDAWKQERADAAHTSLENRARDGDVAAALMLSLQGSRPSRRQSKPAESSEPQISFADLASRDQQINAQAAEIERLRAEVEAAKTAAPATETGADADATKSSRSRKSGDQS